MEVFQEAELIVNDEGRIYHLDLDPSEIPGIVLTVGDPARVGRVSRHFDQVYFERTHREFTSHRGRLGNLEILVSSTGMGTDNVEIFMTELDALVNIDLKTRKIREEKTALKVIRIGTSGSLQADIPVDTLLASSAAIGMDSLMSFYSLPMGTFEHELAADLSSQLQLGFTPYVAYGDISLIPDLHPGITLTCPGFYGPQGRVIRAMPKIQSLTSRLRDYSFRGVRLSNFEMETAGLYAFGALLGHRVVSTNAIIANRSTGKFSSSPLQTVDKLITKILSHL